MFVIKPCQCLPIVSYNFVTLQNNIAAKHVVDNMQNIFTKLGLLDK